MKNGRTHRFLPETAPTTRRAFLAGTMASAAACLAPSGARRLFSPALAQPDRARDADKTIRLALVGDMYLFAHFSSAFHVHDNVEVAALCNPDQRELSETIEMWRERAEEWPDSGDPPEREAAARYQRLMEAGPPVFADFREMLEQMGGEFDGVIVSTFDHLHGPIAGPAIRAGKHVFCERPLGLTIHESRKLAELAEQHQVATSIRNPGNASGQFRRAVEVIRDGLIGEVREAHVWFDRGGAAREQPPSNGHDVPAGLHWNLWLGPAAARDYHPEWMNYAEWRDFSNGGIGTFGPHAANLPFMALNMHTLWEDGHGEPIEAEAECSGANDLSFPEWEIIRWRIPSRGEAPPVRLTWHHGPGFPEPSRDKLHELFREHGVTSADEREKLIGYAGALVIGSEGAVASDDHNVNCVLLPKEKFADMPLDAPEELPASQGHYNDWLHACRGGEQPWAHFGYATALSQLLMLGNIATRYPEQTLRFDPATGEIVNHDDANQHVSYEYREGWSL